MEKEKPDVYTPQRLLVMFNFQQCQQQGEGKEREERGC